MILLLSIRSIYFLIFFSKKVCSFSIPLNDGNLTGMVITNFLGMCTFTFL